MLFPFGKKYHFMQSVSFWVNEWIFKYSDKIMPCKLWSKVTRVFLNINFGAKTLILGKKNWNFVRNVDFLKQLCTTTESEYLIGKHSYFQKIMTFVWLSIYIKKLSNSDKNFYFFLGNVYLYMCLFSLKYFIYWKIVILIQNIILFGDILDKSVIFQVEFTFQVVSILWTNWAMFWEKVTILEKRQLALEVI